MNSTNGKRKTEEDSLEVENCHEAKKQRMNDESYFRCYENYELHATMISDTVRTMTYKRAILSNYKKLYKSSVADVGCGTGILSLFCAAAGARVVYAVEGSSFSSVAEKLVAANGLQEKIRVVPAQAEEVDLPEKVDAIVSEWMGYGLLYENMLSSVIDFRDKYLKQNGLMFPESAKLYVSALGSESEDTLIHESRNFWKRMSELYKVNLDGVLAEMNVNDLLKRAHVDLVATQTLISRENTVFKLDLKTVTKEVLKSVKGPFKLVCFGDSKLYGLVLWFDVAFPGGFTLSTSPASEPTHWEQVIIYLREPVNVTQDTIIEGEMEFRQPEDNHRFLDIRIMASILSRDGETIALIDQSSKLS